MNRSTWAPRRPLAAILVLVSIVGCVSAPRALDDAADLPRLRQARFVLLGEVHDNAAQHRARAALLERLLADRRPTGVVFEQMDRAGDAALAAAPREAEAIADAGRLDRRAWGWPLHKPIVEAALGASAPVFGGNLASAQVRDVVRRGAAAAPADLQAMLAAPGWSAAAERTMESEIDAGHCHALPASQWPAMALAQRTRDAAMAQALLNAAGRDGRAVLIAGNGHVRRDLGVPYYLRAAGVPADQIVSIGYLEAPEREAPYDLVKLTEGTDRGDPCAEFRQ